MPLLIPAAENGVSMALYVPERSISSANAVYGILKSTVVEGHGMPEVARVRTILQ